jgi:hypothetical protein
VLSTRVVTGTAAKLSAGDDVTVRQFDAAGAELVRASFALPRPPTDQLAVPDSLAPPLAFMARVPFDERARAIVLAGAGRTLRRIEVSPRAPTVRLLGMPSFERDTARIAWAGSDPDGDRVTYDVLLAYPGSARTVVLASGVRGTEALVPTRWLPGGEGATLRVEASDGFRVAAAEHAGLSIPDHAPEVTVAYPAAGAAFRSGGRVTLRAIALDPEEGTLSGDRVHWTSDVQGALGTGDDLLVALKAGTHLIRVDAIDARGARAEATVRVVVRD